MAERQNRAVQANENYGLLGDKKKKVQQRESNQRSHERLSSTLQLDHVGLHTRYLFATQRDVGDT